MMLKIRMIKLPLLFLAAFSQAFGQNPAAPSKEYIRLGGQIIAIENGQPSAAPVVSLSPTSLTFASQAVGTTSAAQMVTLTNSGNAPLSISSVTVGGSNPGDFSSTDTCSGQTFAAQAYCTITVTFTPAAAGSRTATISITDNAAGSPQPVALNGMGSNAPAVKLSPPSLSFPSQNTGTSSPSQTVTLTNTGNAALTVSTVSITGAKAIDFTQTNTCLSGSIAPAATCTISVTFSPYDSDTGNLSASVSISDNAGNSPQSVPLTGVSVATAASVTLSSTTLSFASQNMGTSASQTVTVTNSGTAPLNVGAVSISGTNSTDFSSTTTCIGTAVAPSSSCSITVTFKPSAAGSRTGILSITDNAAGSPQPVSLNGTGVAAPVVTLSPTSLSFGNEPVGTTSTSQTVTLTNAGSAALSITSIAAVTTAGVTSTDYVVSNNCGTSVAAGANCTISVAFAPTVAGSRPASLNVTDNASGSPQSVSLSGTGTAPTITFSPTSLSFGNQPVGTSSASQTITVTNTGTATLRLSSVGITGTNSADFSSTTTCAEASVAPAATCSVTITFTPTAPGNRVAMLSVADNVTPSPQSVQLVGAATAPSVLLSTTALSFGGQNVGTASSQTVTVTNNGNAPLNVSTVSIANSADFSSTTTCAGSSLAPAGTCSVTVTFKPSTTGSRSAIVSIADNASGSPQTATLSGTGTLPAVTLSTTALSFGNQNTGTASVAQTVTVTDSGTGPLTVSAVTIGGTNSADFSSTTTCIGANVAASGTCTITVTFRPTATGSRSATVSIADNASTSPQSFTLSGTGTAPVVTLSSTSLSFGSDNTGTTTTAQTVTVKNTGTGPLTITSVATGGTNPSDFKVTANTCGTTVAAAASCTLSVAFDPTATGSRSGTLLITDNAAGSPQSVTLAGTGTAPVVSLSATSISFANTNFGSTSASQTITLKNTGTGPLTISSVATGGTNPTDFTVTANTCGTTVAAASNCTISIAFKPTAMGSRSGTLLITDNAAGSPQSVTLSGTGLAPVVTPSVTSLTFAAQNTGTSSASQTVTIKNTGTAALTISSVALSGTNPGDFSVSNGCGSSVAINGSCSLTVTFKPTAVGTRIANLVITDNAIGSPQTIASLTGTGTAPVVALSQTSINFGTVKVGTTSAAQTVKVTNTGTGALTISSIALTGTNATCFSITAKTCGTSLAARSSCTVSVAFKPQVSTSQTANLSITDNAAGSPQTVALSGQ